MLMKSSDEDFTAYSKYFIKEISLFFTKYDLAFIENCNKIKDDTEGKLLKQQIISENNTIGNRVVANKLGIPLKKDVEHAKNTLKRIVTEINFICFDILIDTFCKNNEFTT